MAKFTCKANSTKLPAMVLCLGEHPGGFCDVGCCCVVFLTGGFYVSGLLFPCHRHSTPASQTREGLHWLWVLPWLLSVALLLPGFSITVLLRALRFWVGIIYPQTFFTLRSFTDIFGTFCDSDAGRTPNPVSFSVLALTELSLPADAELHIGSYKTIDLSIAPVSHEI